MLHGALPQVIATIYIHAVLMPIWAFLLDYNYIMDCFQIVLMIQLLKNKYDCGGCHGLSCSKRVKPAIYIS